MKKQSREQLINTKENIMAQANVLSGEIREYEKVLYATKFAIKILTDITKEKKDIDQEIEGLVANQKNIERVMREYIQKVDNLIREAVKLDGKLELLEELEKEGGDDGNRS